MHKYEPTHQHTHATLSWEVAVCWWSEDYKDGTTERLNNGITLPSPLRSSAESRRACRKRDSRGGGECGEREKAARREIQAGGRAEKRGREKREAVRA